MNSFFDRKEKEITRPVKNENAVVYLSGNYETDRSFLKTRLEKSSDVLFRDFLISGKRAMLVFCDGLCESVLVNEAILKPLTNIKISPFNNGKIENIIAEKTYSGTDLKRIKNLNEVFPLLFSGFCVLLCEDAGEIIAFSAQGFIKRSVDQPFTEVEEKGSMESFVENLTDNISLLRRKLKTPFLKAEQLKVGSTSNTRVCVCYLDDRVKKEYVDEIKKRLEGVEIDSLLSVDMLTEFLDSDRLSLFSSVGRTERPDTLSSKLTEGRVAVLADGSPYALFVPFVFSEHFQTLDDYSFRPYYSLFIRLLRLFCFFISVMLPGLYVAVCVYHQEVLSQPLLVEIAVQENVTPFSITVEALVVHLMYEIVREAGIRMPKAVGHAVSIVGALVIGEAAVSAGIIAAPMVIIVALTAIGSFVVSSLYESVSVLRLLFIIIGGVSGFFGIMLFFGLIIINISSLNPYNVPFSATFIPSNIGAFRDTFFREGWKKLGKRTLEINSLEK